MKKKSIKVWYSKAQLLGVVYTLQHGACRAFTAAECASAPKRYTKIFKISILPKPYSN